MNDKIGYCSPLNICGKFYPGMGCPGDSRFKTGFALTALLCIFSGSRLDSFALFVYVRFHDGFFVRQFTGVYEFQDINYSQGTVPHGFFVSPGASGRKESTSESDADGEKVRRHVLGCNSCEPVIWYASSMVQAGGNRKADKFQLHQAHICHAVPLCGDAIEGGE